MRIREKKLIKQNKKFFFLKKKIIITIDDILKIKLYIWYGNNEKLKKDFKNINNKNTVVEL